MENQARGTNDAFLLKVYPASVCLVMMFDDKIDRPHCPSQHFVQFVQRLGKEGEVIQINVQNDRCDSTAQGDGP
jgi:hypothetical protein